uniref:Uncharacterized protein n=1 Tax=Catharus ustulatus TaxID=91951 RepID=A0A8C3V911_CATUS
DPLSLEQFSFPRQDPCPLRKGSPGYLDLAVKDATAQWPVQQTSSHYWHSQKASSRPGFWVQPGKCRGRKTQSAAPRPLSPPGSTLLSESCQE